VILTNRNCYSATSFFAAAAKALPNVTQIGDTTGGGAGAPHGGQMPNGWYYRFSVTRSAYPSSEGLIDFEVGVAPDIAVNMDPIEEDQGIDSILETAIEFLIDQ
ncbi:MAG: peptidase S41, partial [Salinivirgaceae bacterium]